MSFLSRLVFAVFILPAAAMANADADPIPRLAQDLAALTESVESAAAEAELRVLFDGLASGPDAARDLPAAMAQGASLALRAQTPASRGVFYDLTRDMLITSIELTGRSAKDSGILSAWDQTDPLVAQLAPGQGLALSDVRALDELTSRNPGHQGHSIQEFWEQQAGQPVNRVFPTRMRAWADGALAAWPQLDDGERQLVAHALDNPAVPPAAALKKIIGTDDMIGWLAATNVPMTKAERSASPELLGYMRQGAFAGPLKEPLRELIAAAAAGGGGDMSAAAQQLMRLNNWSAMTGEMHSWDSYRYMTQGY